MYKQYSADEYRTLLGLPLDYKVDGVVVHGSMQRKHRNQVLREILARLKVPFEYEFVQENGFFENVTVINFQGKRIWYDIVYGGAYLSELLHVASLFGSQKHILIGSCGGLKQGASRGHLILPNDSYGDESSTRMYDPQDTTHIFPADLPLTNSLQLRLRDTYRIFNGRLVTCQAMLAETKEDIISWSKAGYVGIEMESATLFAVSKYFNIPAAALLFISDNLIENETHFDDVHQRQPLHDVRAQLFLTAFQEMLS